MKKIFNIALLLVVFVFVFSACSANTNGVNSSDENLDIEKTEEDLEDVSLKIKREINVAVPAGTPALSIIKMINEKYSPDGYVVNYEVVNSTDLLSAKILSKEADILIIPTNLAAKLHSKGIEYKLKSINVWGSLYIVTSEDKEINSLSDLSGKEIYTIGKGLTPDIITKYILDKNGVEDVEFNYLAGATELAPMFLAGKSEISLMPEPLLSLVKVKKEDTKILMDLQKEWANLSDDKSSYPQSGLYINNEILLDDDFTFAFLEEVENSIEWLNENPSDAGLYYEAQGLSPAAKIVEKSISGSNFKFANTRDIRDTMDGYFEVLFDANPDSIGGVIPNASLYE